MVMRGTNQSKKYVAKASMKVVSSVQPVWDALTDPKAICQYMFGAQVISDWQEGSPIVWRGEWQGKAYEDKGEILHLVPIQLIQYSHYSPLSGAEDRPENYHVVTVELSCDGKNTIISLTQDNNASQEEREHSQKNWEIMLANLKKYLEEPGHNN